MSSKNAIVIGAGIAGLAMVRALCMRGYNVTVFERNEKAIGASIRNFGMIWPIGQPDGTLYRRALRSREVWKTLCTEAGLWHEEQGSMHLAYSTLEWQVLQEFAAANVHRPLVLLDGIAAAKKSVAANPNGLKGALWSADEMIIEPRVAMEKLPGYFTEKWGVSFYFNTAVTAVEYPYVMAGGRQWCADEIFVCSGADFETLYPQLFAAAPITKCKLQMMRMDPQPGGWRMGPSLCGGLSLTHYKSFAAAPSLPLLIKHFKQTAPLYIQWGIHVMICQNREGALTIGDSHEYGLVHDPFDRTAINDLILRYLQQFACIKSWNLQQTWNGIYPKLTNGATEMVLHPQEGVTIVNGLGGAGVTLSFGLAEEIMNGDILFASNGLNIKATPA